MRKVFMAWNEPGKRDPWKGRQDSPDINDLLRRGREGLRRVFGGGGNGGGGGSSSHSGGFLIAVLALIVLWVAFGSFKMVDARQIGVVLRFGQFNRIMNNGLNLKWPSPIEEVITVEATSVQSVSDEVRMLTKDENIVVIDFNVQYTRADARKYLFSANQPDETLKQAAESAVRQVIGSSPMDTILSGQGAETASETEKLLQQTLDAYGVGLLVKAVNFQKILPPPEVKEAFDDANNAGNNQQQFINDAAAYLSREVPLARGEAARIRAGAEGYKASQIAAATGDAQRFTLIDAQYRAAPDITRKRLYLETMQSLLSTTLKVVDQSGGRNMLYLPLDKLKTQAGEAASTAAAAAAAAGEAEQRAPARSNRGGGQ
jgi:membrane protease subunit HflK